MKNGVQTKKIIIKNFQGYEIGTDILSGKRLDQLAQMNSSHTTDMHSYGIGRCIQASFRLDSIKTLSKLPLLNIEKASFKLLPSNLEKLKNHHSPPLAKEEDLKSVKTEKSLIPKEKSKSTSKNKKLGFKESIKSLMKNHLIASLATMTIAQGLCVTLMEYVWRSHLKLACPTPSAFSAYMGTVAMILGITTAFMMIVSPILFKKIGWRGVANVTPRVLTIGGCVFFSACIGYHVSMRLGMVGLGQTLLPLSVIVGSALYVLSRGSKFSLFKPSEEMVFIKMNKEERMSGKAAVDVVGANVGKTGGSVLQQVKYC